MIRRKQPDPPPPGPPWQQRLQAARGLIRRHRNDATTETRLDQVEAALAMAHQDRSKLEAAVRQLDPARVSAELKAALRSGDTPERLITTLRRRHEMVHSLSNRLEEVDQQIALTLADLETLAARITHTSFAAGGSHEAMDAELDQLHLDVTALAAAHEEIAHL